MKKSLLEIHGAVLLFGLAGLFGKIVLLPAWSIVLGRVIFASLFLLIIIKYRGNSLKIDKGIKQRTLIALGILLAIHWVTFFHSIQISTVAIGLLTFSTFPIFVTFLEPILFKEPFKKSNIIVALITFSGVAMVVPTIEVSNNITQGVFWGIISGLTFAILSLLNRKAVKHCSSLTIAFYQNSIATLFLLPIIFAIDQAPTIKDIALLALLGIVFTALAHTLFINSLKNIKTQTASIITCLEPVYGIVAAMILLNEIPSGKETIGMIIILSTVLYSTIQSKR